MRLSWRKSSRVEDRMEEWIAQRHQQRVLAGETNPKGPCPDESFLQDLARKSKRIVLSDPRIDHAATCPRCMKRLLEIRQKIQSHGRKLILAGVITSCLILIAVLIALGRYRINEQRPAPTIAVISQTINLWDGGTSRGAQTGVLKSISLPAAMVKATVILPVFSAPGRYLVIVARNQNGEGILTEVRSLSEHTGNQERVPVDLDLRSVTPGKYFLLTLHEQSQAEYYYPLEIK